MFRILLLFLCCVITIDTQAQKLTVEGMSLVGEDLSATTEKRLDAIGGPCALVKVKLALEGASFGGNVITPIDYRDGEYWVYMTEGSYLLQVKHPQFQPMMVNFRDYDISKVVPLKTYMLSFVRPQTQATMGTLQVSYEPAGSEVFLDGLRLGVTPLIKKGISPGPHKVVIKKSYRVTERKDIIVTAGESSQLIGVLKNPEMKDNMTASEWTAMGIAYAKGMGLGQMKTDVDKALECLKKAADMGDAEAMVNLGMIYELGVIVRKQYHKETVFGTPQYEAEAVKWYRKASDLGDADGQVLLGNMYYQGKGNLPKDYTEAAALFRKAAEQNNALGQRRLGVLYMVGYGVKENPVEAAEWFQKAANQEDGYAQSALGKCYENGIGVPMDKNKALHWYRKSSDNGIPVSAETLERLKIK